MVHEIQEIDLSSFASQNIFLHAQSERAVLQHGRMRETLHISLSERKVISDLFSFCRDKKTTWCLSHQASFLTVMIQMWTRRR